MQEAIYKTPKEESMDEQMIGTKCRQGFRQYLPLKPTKWVSKSGLWQTQCLDTVVTCKLTPAKSEIMEKGDWQSEW